MFLRFFFLSVLAVTVIFIHGVSRAQPSENQDTQVLAPAIEAEESVEGSQENQEEAEAEQKWAGPAKDMYKTISAFSQKLDESQMRHFFTAYSNYNLIATVKTIRSDVSAAIDACSENNPDMKEDLHERFGVWKGAVGPLIKDAEGNMNNMLLAQDYSGPEEIKHIFELVDETREYTASQFEKIPVTTPEACEFLLNKMDETQESMLSLLQRTLISYPQIFPPEDIESLESPHEESPHEANEDL